MISVEVEEYIYPNGAVGLRGFSHEFEGGEMIVGPTGCGKSTILRLISGAIPKLYGGTLRGRVVVLGTPPSCEKAFLVSQRVEEMVTCSEVLEEVMFPLIQRGCSVSEAKKVAEDVLEEVGIGHLADRRLTGLSSGELQLVEIAAAITSGAIILLDEPFAFLSRRNAKRVIKVLKDYPHVVAEHRIEFAKHFDVVDMGLKVEEVEIPEVELGEVVYEPLSLRKRELVAITGDNGVGKTRMLIETARDMKKRRMSVGLVLQHPAYHLAAKRVADECDLLEEFELSHLADRHPQSLSYGQMKRLAIAKAFKHDVVLLDEPTAGQDPNFRVKLVRLLRLYGKTALIATHDEALAKLCDRVVELRAE
ncbi:MAG: ATP-binding cassette domain-containing protein [Archaeoglobaceae archaeon]